MSIVWRLIKARLKPHTAGMATMILIAVSVSATPYGFAMLGRWLVDDVLQVSGPPKVAAVEQQDGQQAASEPVWQPKSTEQKLRLLLVFFVASLTVHIVVTGLAGASELLNARIVHRVIFALRTSVHEKLATMDMAVFSREQVGQLMTRVLDDVGGIPGNLTHLVVDAFAQVCMLVLGLVLLLRMNPRMTLVVLGVLPFYALTCIFLLPRIKRNTEQLRSQAAGFNGFVVERLTNVMTIKNYAQEDREVDTFSRRLDSNLALSRRQQRLDLYFGTLTTVITGLGTLAVLWLGFLNIKAGKMQIGEVLAFHGVTAQLFVPVSALVGLASVTQTLEALAKRVNSVLDAPTTLADASKGEAPAELRGDIAFEGVSLQYEEGGPFAVSNVNLSIPAGSTVCLVGPTGCGKSTLIVLLTRLYDPTAGTIRIDGTDIRELPVRTLRRAVGNVLHDCQLFAGTLAENIAYGAPHASRDEVEGVARLVGLHEFISAMPRGYDTPANHGGATLNAENLARLGLARALLTKPAVLTVDDTYAAIEEEAERPLRAAVRSFLSDRTILIATSRLSMCEDADMVVVMQRGQIEQVGTHKELLGTPGIYRRMYMRQMGMDELDASCEGR